MPPKASSQQASSVAEHYPPLAQDEIAFLWRTLSKDGQFTADKLEEVMKCVCGEDISMWLAKSMINALDFNSDGVVGADDFKYFMSLAPVASRDPEEVVFHPHRAYRREHGLNSKKPAEAKETHSQKKSGAAFSSTPAVPETKAAVEPKVPPGKKRGPNRAHQSVDSAPPVEKTRSTEGGGPRPDATSEGGSRPKSDKEKARQKQNAEKHVESPASLGRPRYQRVLQEYAEKKHAELCKHEEEYKGLLFETFASNPNGMTKVDYHRMMGKWNKIARPSLPGDPRIGDSLATFNYILRCAREFEEADPDKDADAARDSSKCQGRSVSKDCTPAEAKFEDQAVMTRQHWDDLTRGKYNVDKSPNAV